MPETFPADAAAAFAQAALQDYLDGAEEHLRRRLHDAGEAGIVVNVSIGAVSATVQPGGGVPGPTFFWPTCPSTRPRGTSARERPRRGTATRAERGDDIDGKPRCRPGAAPGPPTKRPQSTRARSTSTPMMPF